MTDRFHLLLIKPSRYDDDGYVVQWRRSVLPSNALSVLNALGEDCAERQVLGPEVEIRVEAYDDHTGLPPMAELIARLQAASAGALVGIVGAHSAQFPRGADIARRFHAAGIPAVIGGFHVSGAYSMLPEMPPELRQVIDEGISLFVGEGEGRLDAVIRDAHAGRMRPVYDYGGDLVDLSGAVIPRGLPATVENRMLVSVKPADPIEAGRGCPFKCSFCTVINVHGRQARTRDPEAIVRQIRSGVARGRDNFFFTDDNLVRNRRWREIFEGLIRLREEEGLAFNIMIQVDAQSDRDPDFIPMAVRAGCHQVFIGMESINSEALASVGKGHNDARRYRRLFLNWKRHGVVIMVGYILGFPGDTPESIRRDVETIKRELAVDLAYFYVLTPLPGSEDHVRMWRDGVELDPDLSHYTSYRSIAPHPTMSTQVLDGLYDEAWRSFYDDAHCERILTRHAVLGGSLDHLFPFLLVGRGAHPIDDAHPFEFGFVRVKSRRERRPDMPREPLMSFLARRVWETAEAQVRWIRLFRHMSPMVERARAAAAMPRPDDPALMVPAAPVETPAGKVGAALEVASPVSGVAASSGFAR
ncbi:B12-binding domain-containing radical SAM protein [Imhoffiella purpurea]|uniref:Elongator protein 3/MiaB/NifB n=1 Tax=Imhoffiella purpurea TaxID=1249627 RepID=W9VT24_9GAMM|nr:radical SAM protein [Imhoffiella purpurea]EXJ13530.1 Elongator protein 3/MiaB/NifB [Imhoffiella purpurea]